MSEYSLKRFIKRTLRLDPALQKDRLMSVLPSYLDQVVFGLLLSDGSVERPTRTGGARLSVILGINTYPATVVGPPWNGGGGRSPPNLFNSFI